MSTNNDATLQLEALQSLLQSPGWQILSDQIRRTAASQMDKMRNAASQESLLRHTYTFMALQDVLAVPDLLMKPLVMQLQLLKK